jgi:hypothetical protein
MSRGLTAGNKTLLGAGVLYPALFFDFVFDSGTTRFWTGETSINADLGDGTVTWTGGGLFGGVEMAGETETLEAKKTIFTLNGVDPSYYATAISTQYRERPAHIWFALMNSAGDTVDYYYLLDEPRMDNLVTSETGQSMTLRLECESRLIDFHSPRAVYFANSDHQKIYPGDKFYEFTPTLPGKKLPWGFDSLVKSERAGTPGGGLQGGPITEAP